MSKYLFQFYGFFRWTQRLKLIKTVPPVHRTRYLFPFLVLVLNLICLYLLLQQFNLLKLFAFKFVCFLLISKYAVYLFLKLFLSVLYCLLQWAQFWFHLIQYRLCRVGSRLRHRIFLSDKKWFCFLNRFVRCLNTNWSF